MPRGPKGEKRPADVVGWTILSVARLADLGARRRRDCLRDGWASIGADGPAR